MSSIAALNTRNDTSMTSNRFERMVSIPEDEYRQLLANRQLQKVNNPLESHFQTLSNEYNKLNMINDPQLRVLRQGETLDELIKVKEQLRERLREATPKPYRTRAESLYNFMKDKIQVNPKGEIYTNEGVRIEGSNIADLVQHAVRDRQRNINPLGWKTFVSQLKDHNAPQMILNYNTLDELRPSLSLLTPQPAIANRFGRSSAKSEIRKRSRSQSKAKTPVQEKIRRQSIPSTPASSYLATPPAKKPLRKSSRTRRRPTYLSDYVT